MAQVTIFDIIKHYGKEYEKEYLYIYILNIYN